MNERYIVRDERIRDNCVAYLSGLEIVEPLEVTIKPYKPNRSLAQNRLYWRWVGIIVQHIEDTVGQTYSTEDVHDWLRDEFLEQKVVEIGGRVKLARKSTAALRTKEFAEYLDQIDRYCADRLQLILPHPEDLYYEAMRMVA